MMSMTINHKRHEQDKTRKKKRFVTGSDVATHKLNVNMDVDKWEEQHWHLGEARRCLFLFLLIAGNSPLIHGLASSSSSGRGALIAYSHACSCLSLSGLENRISFSLLLPVLVPSFSSLFFSSSLELPPLFTLLHHCRHERT
jgi:hypothetical protein